MHAAFDPRVIERAERQDQVGSLINTYRELIAWSREARPGEYGAPELLLSFERCRTCNGRRNLLASFYGNAVLGHMRNLQQQHAPRFHVLAATCEAFQRAFRVAVDQHGVAITAENRMLYHGALDMPGQILTDDFTRYACRSWHGEEFRPLTMMPMQTDPDQPGKFLAIGPAGHAAHHLFAQPVGVGHCFARLFRSLRYRIALAMGAKQRSVFTKLQIGLAGRTPKQPCRKCGILAINVIFFNRHFCPRGNNSLSKPRG